MGARRQKYSASPTRDVMRQALEHALRELDNYKAVQAKWCPPEQTPPRPGCASGSRAGDRVKVEQR